MKTTKAVALEPTILLLGMYILMHVQNEHTEILTGALFVKTKGWKLSR